MPDATTVATDLYLLVAAVGLALSVSYAGLPVLGQGAFVAVGGFATVLLGPGHAGLPVALAAGLAVATAGLLGWLVGFGAARLTGGFLALATWAFAWLVDAVLVAFPALSGGSSGLTAPVPARLTSTTLGVSVEFIPAVHIGLAASLSVLGLVLLHRVARGPGGLDLAALREGPVLAESLGIPVANRRRSVLAVTATFGGLSGAGTAVLLGLVAPTDVGPLLSLQLFVAVLLGGTATVWGPVIGVAVLVAVPPVANALAAAGSLPVARAGGAVTAALLVAALAGRPVAARLAATVRRARSHPAETAAAEPPDVPRRHRRTPPHRVLLSARGVTAGYDGEPVLHGVGLVLRAGDVHALIGPNGSGKSTLLRVLAGALPARRGTVRVAGGVVPAGPARRVAAGVSRTFQRTTVLPGLPVRRQLEVAARGGTGGRFAVVRALLAAPSAADAALLRTRLVDEALVATGLSARANALPTQLSSGDQRLLQVARAIATGATVLLLDEPAAGMSQVERTRLVGILQGIARNGRAVLLVEHDMRLVAEVADWVTVLAAGRVLARGTPEQVQRDPLVRRAYLGVDVATPPVLSASRPVDLSKEPA